MVFLAAMLLPGIAGGGPGQRLLATGGLSTIEGVAGGGLVPMAVISGYGSSGEPGLAVVPISNEYAANKSNSFVC